MRKTILAIAIIGTSCSSVTKTVEVPKVDSTQMFIYYTKMASIYMDSVIDYGFTRMNKEYGSPEYNRINRIRDSFGDIRDLYVDSMKMYVDPPKLPTRPIPH